MEIFERNKLFVPKPEILESRPFEKKIENLSEKKYSNFSQKKQEDFSQKKIEDFSWKKKQENLSTFTKNSFGNFRHFNQIAEISDQKASNLPYFEQKKESLVPQNLSEKFNTEKSQENYQKTEENQDFAKIWFNPKPYLNKFSEKTQKKLTANSLQVPEKKTVEKINLNSILKNSTHKNQSKMIENDNFYPLKTSRKIYLYQWLISINLLKENLKNNLIEKLPKICRNGVIFADIINRLESRDKADILKGIARKPKKQAEIHANFTRVFDYLSKFEKMNKRFLYSYEPFFEANEEIFWSFLDDIWHCFHSKLSNSDSRFQELQNSKRVSLNESWNKRFFNSSKKSELSNASYGEICQENNVKSRKKTTENSRFESLKPSNHEENTKKYEVQAWTLPPKLEEPPVKESKEKNKPLLPETLKQEVLSWLKELGYSSYLSKIGSKNTWEDPTRNGLLLGLLLNRLHYTKLTLCKEPKSLSECMKNLDLAFQAIRKLQLSLPYEFLWKINEILLGNEVVIYQVLLCLKHSMDKNLSYSTRLSTRNSKSLTLRTSSPLQRSFSRTDSARLLIKNKDEIEDAEKKIFDWLKDSGFFVGLSMKNPQDFNEIFPLLTNGMIFCDLAERICGVSLVGVNRKPLNEKSRVSNVAKAMELLKEKGFINLQCWTMSLKEIPEGNYLFILDILELLYGLTKKNSFVRKDYSMKKNPKKEELASLELCESNREIFRENMEKNRENSCVSQKEELRNADLLINSGILKNKLGKKLENTAVIQVKSIKFNEDFSGKSKEKST